MATTATDNATGGSTTIFTTSTPVRCITVLGFGIFLCVFLHFPGFFSFYRPNSANVCVLNSTTPRFNVFVPPNPTRQTVPFCHVRSVCVTRLPSNALKPNGLRSRKSSTEVWHSRLVKFRTRNFSRAKRFSVSIVKRHQTRWMSGFSRSSNSRQIELKTVYGAVWTGVQS